MPQTPPAKGDPAQAGGDLQTGVMIDATCLPGIELLATFLPANPVTGGTRRIAATQLGTAFAPIRFDDALPIFWLASVLRKGDVAPNLLAQPYLDASDNFIMTFGTLVLTHDQGAWQIPHYNSDAYSVLVGFGIGPSGLSWGYAAPCQPGQALLLAAGSYQLVRSDGRDRIGDPVADGLDSWTMPLGFEYTLAFDSCGNGALSTNLSAAAG